MKKNKYNDIISSITQTVNTTVLDSTWDAEQCLEWAKKYFDKIDLSHTKVRTLAMMESAICFLILAEEKIINDTSGAF